MTTMEYVQSALERDLTLTVAEFFPRAGEWTEARYWPFAEHARIVELSDGKLIVPPSPTTAHQDVVLTIYAALRAFNKVHNVAKVSLAPLPVRLWPEKVREPDVLVMLKAHAHRVQNQYWEPPDLVVEVLSPGTEKTDRKEKFGEYAEAQISEYWIISIEAQTVEVYRLEDSAYTLDAAYTGEMQIESRVLVGFTIAVADVFEEG